MSAGLVLAPGRTGSEVAVALASAVLASWLAFAASRHGALGLDLRLATSAAVFGAAFLCGRGQEGGPVARMLVVVSCTSAIVAVLVPVDPLVHHVGDIRRASGLLGSPQALAAVLAMSVPWLLCDRPRTSPSDDLAPRDGADRVLLLMLGVGLGATGSRAGLLAMAVAAVVTRPRVPGGIPALLTGAALGSALMAVAVVPTAALLAGGVLAIGMTWWRVSTSRVAALGVTAVAGTLFFVLRPDGLGSRLSDTRTALWALGFEEWRSSPWLGVGGGTARTVVQPDGAYTIRYLHSDLLEIAATSGLIGLVLLLGVVWALARLMRRSAVPPAGVATLAAVAVVGTLDLSLHIPAVAALAGWLVASSSKGWTCNANERSSPLPR